MTEPGNQCQRHRVRDIRTDDTRATEEGAKKQQCRNAAMPIAPAPTEDIATAPPMIAPVIAIANGRLLFNVGVGRCRAKAQLSRCSSVLNATEIAVTISMTPNVTVMTESCA